MSIEKYISPYIANQLPRLYREEGPIFISFLKAYFEFMEQSGEVLNESRSLMEYRDIDTTLPEFIQHFKNKYMAGLPEGLLGDQKLLQKHIKEIYGSKGTIRGLELVFRLLANQNIEVYYPGDDILKPSDGVWIKPTYLEVSSAGTNVLLIGEKITGRESGATAIVEDFQSRYINQRKINILYLSNVRGVFKTGELLLNNVITDPLQSPAVVGSMSDILINESGFDYNIGDVLDVVGGSGILGKAVVSNTSPRAGSVEFKIINGGSGYANNNVWAPTTVSVVAVDANNPGIGATFAIGNLGDTEVITTAVDEIAPYANTSLGAVDYNFHGGFPVVDINTPLDQAFNIQDITVGTILSLRAINPGAGYNGPVIVTVTNDVIAGLNITDTDDGTIKGKNANISGSASAGRGAIDSVLIFDSGLGYQEGDVVSLNNANNPFIAGGTVRLGHEGRGEGYWKDTRSFLNSDKFIQDSFYYQEYSFEVRVALAFQNYADILKRLWQPAGTEAFGKVVVGQEIETGSTIEEVEIEGIYITAYLTSFNTMIETTQNTSTMYASQYATTYFTEKLTDTQRTTTTTLLDTLAERVVNGTFNLGISNWAPRSTELLTWDSTTQKLKIERAGGGGTAEQTIATTAGRTYYVTANYTGSTGTGGNIVVRNSSDAIITTESRTGAANSFVFTFVAQDAQSLIGLIVAGGVDGTFALFDDISAKELPELSRGTAYATNIATTTVFNTIRSTDKATSTVFDTALVTTYVTQQNTLSLFNTNRATNRTTSSVYNTIFDTSLATNRATDTTRATVLQTNKATTSSFNTLYDTFYLTNRATSTLGVTAYETSKATTTTTSSVYNTTYNTNKATDTTVSTNFATSKATDTVISTAFVTTFATTFGTTGTTTTSFDTSRTTTFATTIVTAYLSSYATTYSTNKATTTSVSTSKATATSVGTSAAVATSKSTSKATGTSKSTTTAYNTTTSYSTTYLTSSFIPEQSITQPATVVQFTTVAITSKATGTSRATTTAYNTTTSYVTNYNTTTSFVSTYNTTTTYVSSFSTTTIFNTSKSTAIATSRNTTFDTSKLTAFATSKSTATSDQTTVDTTANTLRNTAFATTTAYTTTFNTAFATTTIFATSKSTQIATLTSAVTAYDTVVATTKITDTAFDTFQNTTKGTTKSTDTIFGTGIITTFATTTGFITTYNTNRSTQKATNTAYDTVYDTSTLRVTDIVTNRTTLFNTNKATTSVFNTTVVTNRSTTSVFDTSRTTIYVDVPTTFQTFYGTATTVATDYDTGAATQRTTATNFDTGYDTARVTSINTSTDLVF